MKKKVESIISRRLTRTDFFNINKPPGVESGGGGQSYIDIPTSDVTVEQWLDFFKNIDHTEGHNGPEWNFTINSLGLSSPITLKIAQRRDQSVSIRSQKIHSLASNRVPAWHPDNGFPQPSNPYKREEINNLVIYFVKTTDGEYWAGWIHRETPDSKWSINEQLSEIFTNDSASYIKTTTDVFVDTEINIWPFSIAEGEVEKTVLEETKVSKETKKKEITIKTKKKVEKHKKRDEGEIISELFDEDETEEEKDDEVKETVMKVRKRNQNISRKLKELYQGQCQLTGEDFTFTKKNGETYSEVHHLIPLGEGGSDSIYNIIIVSPLIHRMLHYANVSEIDLEQIKENKLSILINKKDYIIEWHPKHSEFVKKFAGEN